MPVLHSQGTLDLAFKGLITAAGAFFEWLMFLTHPVAWEPNQDRVKIHSFTPIIVAPEPSTVPAAHGGGGGGGPGDRMLLPALPLCE